MKRAALVNFAKTKVAPHAGAWIETAGHSARPSWRLVAPHAGAWIETTNSVEKAPANGGRPPRGGVD